MKTKVCFKCKKRKLIIKFRECKNGKNKGYYNSYCNECEKIHKRIPWIATNRRIITRCHSKTHPYFKKGRKNFITSIDLKYLWYRDKAYLLKKPSIDRIDSKGNYTLNNCRFIELRENILNGLKTKKRDNKGRFLIQFNPAPNRVREEMRK